MATSIFVPIKPVPARERRQIRKLFLKYRGASTVLARQLETSQATVSLWLCNKRDSPKVQTAVLAFLPTLQQLELQRESEAQTVTSVFPSNVTVNDLHCVAQENTSQVVLPVDSMQGEDKAS